MYLDPTKFQGDMSNHERMHLFSRDLIRVKNPLTTDFRFKFDSIWYTIKAGETKDWERYLADHYVKEVSQHIIGELVHEQGEKALATQAVAQPTLLLDKYVENRTIWDKLPRTDNPELQRKIVRDVVVGLIERFGEDRDIPQQQQAKLKTDTPLYRQLLDEFTTTPLGEETTVTSDKSLESEVTVDESTPNH